MFVCRLLDVLAGRTERKGIRGHTLVDGRGQPQNFKCMTGYVVQVGKDTTHLLQNVDRQACTTKFSNVMKYYYLLKRRMYAIKIVEFY